MIEYTIKLPIWQEDALELIAKCINNPDLLYDLVDESFRNRVPEWPKHGWELQAVAEGPHIFVTARRKT